MQDTTGADQAAALSDDSDHESDIQIVDNHYDSSANSETNIQQRFESDVKKKSFSFMSKVAEGVKFVVDSITGKLVFTI